MGPCGVSGIASQRIELTLFVGLLYFLHLVVGGGAEDIDEHALVGAGTLHGLVQGSCIHVGAIVERPLHRLAELSTQFFVQTLL